MKNPRVSVTLDNSDVEMMRILCKKNGGTISSLVRRMVKDWLKGYEDRLLAKRAEKAEERWEKAGQPTITHEELWKRLDT